MVPITYTQEYTQMLKERELKASTGGRPYRVVGAYGEKIVMAHSKKEAVAVARLPLIKSVTRL